MKMVACEEIHWHDCMIRSVLILPVVGQVELHIDYPVNWEESKWEPRVLKFLDAYGYKEHEGSFAGTPTILSATSSTQQNGWQLVRLDTNAGFREIFCKGISLELSATG